MSLNTRWSVDYPKIIHVMRLLVSTVPHSTKDLHNVSNVIHQILSHLCEHDFNRKFKIILVDNPFKLNQSLYKIIVLFGIKFRKSLFSTELTDDEDSKEFLAFIIKELVISITIEQSFTLSLLKTLDLIIKNRPDVLTLNLSWFTLTKITQIANIFPIKKTTQDISRILLKTIDLNEFLNDFELIPIKRIDFLELIEIEKCCIEQINQKALNLFKYNVESRDGALLYNSIIEYSNFDDFFGKLWPLQLELISKEPEESEGEFSKSLIKYWIPLNVRKYKSDFYDLVRISQVTNKIKALTLLETKKKCYTFRHYDNDALKFLNYPKTHHIGVQIICMFSKESLLVDTFTLECMKPVICDATSTVDNFPHSFLKSIKQLISQIFINTHVHMNHGELNLEFLGTYSKFLDDIYSFSLENLNNNYEYSSQLLQLIFKIASGDSSDLVTPYKIRIQYEKGLNSYFKWLYQQGFWARTFSSKEIEMKLNDFLNLPMNLVKACPSITLDYVTEFHLEKIRLIDDDLTQLIFEALEENMTVQVVEKFKLYSRLIIKYDILRSHPLDSDLVVLNRLYVEKSRSMKTQNLFICTLILELLAIIEETCHFDQVSLLEGTLRYLEHIFENDEHRRNLDERSMKIFEAFINAFLKLLTISGRNNWVSFDRDLILNGLSKIIEKSNLKKPCTSAVKVLEEFGEYLEDFPEFKISFLDDTLGKLESDRETSSIRRNPETRLVIQAICRSEENPEKLQLHRSINVLIQTVCDNKNEQAVSSALNCLELLVADREIYQFTVKFIRNITKICIQYFDTTNWTVRNADIQLLKTLIDRFLGVPLQYGRRSKSVGDFLTQFPQLTEDFIDALFSSSIDGNMSDGAIVVLTFFAESKIIVNNPLMDDQLKSDLGRFKQIFIKMIKNHGGQLGEMASKSLASLCSEEEIPSLLLDLLIYVNRNCTKIKVDVLKNLVSYVDELYNKMMNSPNRNETDCIHIFSLLSSLFDNFRNNEHIVMNLVSLNILSTIFSLPICSYNDYKNRIWLVNHLPHLTKILNGPNLTDVLDSYLADCETPDHVHICVLSILTQRFGKPRDFIIHNRETLNTVIKTLLVALGKLDNTRTYIINAYAHTLLLLSPFCEDFHVESAEIEADLETESVYKTLVYVTYLSYDLLLSNDTLLNRIVDLCIVNINECEELLLDITSVLKHLFGLSLMLERIEIRFKILKLAGYLYLKSKILSFEVWKFIKIIIKQPISSSCCLYDLLKPDNLIMFLENGYHFYQDTPTFYLVENDITIDKSHALITIKNYMDDLL